MMENREKGLDGLRQVVVLGLARSGVAVAKCLLRQGVKVVASDIRPYEQCTEAKELEELGLQVVCGEHPDSLIHESVDMVIKNPGIPYRVQPIREAQRLGIPVMTEVEIAGRLLHSPIVGITGSNGKTTTTTWVGEMLKAGNVPAVVAGNIGRALSEVIDDLSSDEWLVAELSSFQLKGTKHFHPQVAALLNVEPAHLDYHGDIEDYIASKSRLFHNQTMDDVAVLNADSEVCRKIAKNIKSRIFWFSRQHSVNTGVCVEGDWIVAKLPEEYRQGEEWRGKETFPVLRVDQVSLHGEFNLENAMAATAIALACVCPLNGIQQALLTFAGVEHRLEYVKSVKQVHYYNDSKATNLQAVKRALESFTKPVVWIAGGLDRGEDFKTLGPVIQDKVKEVISYGEAAPVFIQRAKEEGKPYHQVKEIREAVDVAHQVAKPGDVVLLSPGCASWDIYTSFEQRGSIFKQAVHTL